MIIDGPDGPVQTAAFELNPATGAVDAIYIVRNPDKLRHLSGRERLEGLEGLE